ncbi:acetyl/propionyl/methylcrotonyl-CoA carboxylase subunit alpha [Kineococcus rubinsiae]|uniref:acetyl/propionyl/methylcrotonyl-CoA carboxylase subunit alpha n=1 Tax=Kineococcus rubinsiae TaxID=2609562 RepID=UPI00142F8F6D|nr:biotin carboxylase N-terminal domain-containing protein [Kineococcus rubinsiae]NIZ91695.1 ATP-grasp domain-containing protein [Kineococcus rubinsiae]
MKKVLIANRGEIAVRIARACADYGVGSVAVHSDPDADALHVRVADEAWGLGGASPAETYLDAGKLLAAARASGADAVHPGYGFLSESAEFARRVEEAGLFWIGPSPESIEALGDKTTARRIATSVGAPLVAGTPGPVAGVEEVLAFADEHGLPIAIKAAFGGGGRGLRVVHRREDVRDAFDAAVREAVTAFGRGECFVEQYLERPRHVEAQVLGDGRGGVVVVGTRDCSLQRRHQKLVEEAPAPFLTAEQHHLVVTAARDVCAAVSYRGAGTVEFLVGTAGTVSFLEVNTRLQVEHPVTEETTGVDLVRQQLLVADGLPLEVTGTPEPRGHAFEFRLNAEDPGRGFLPTPGTVTRFDVPGGRGVRVDSGVVAGSVVPGRYDSLLAKLVVTGRDRPEALRRARRALAELAVEGVSTVLPFHRRVVEDPAFTAEGSFGVHTRWIETECAWLDELAAPRPPEGEAEEEVVRTWVELDGRRVRLGLPAALLRAGSPGTPPAGAAPASGPGSDPAVLTAPVAGTLLHWTAQDGAEVRAGDPVAVVEAMKMETVVSAHADGVLRVSVAAGEACAAGAELARITAAG